jgi:hypothetical protein
MKYFKHLKENWKVALHSLNDFLEHFLHGLIPAISWKHGCNLDPIVLYQKTIKDKDEIRKYPANDLFHPCSKCNDKNYDEDCEDKDGKPCPFL